MAPETIVLYRAPDAQEAALLAQALAAEGIAVQLAGGAAQIGFGELGADALRVDVHVPAGDAARGRAILESVFADRREQRARGASWTCAACGERNAASFDLCWSCAEPAPQQDAPPE